jgi:hypothetical protein
VAVIAPFGTLVDVGVTVGAFPSGGTGTTVGIHTIGTGAIHTGRRGAFIDVAFTVGTRVTRNAVTRVAVHTIGACSPVLAGVGGTFIDVRFAVGTRVTRHTRATIRID